MHNRPHISKSAEGTLMRMGRFLRDRRGVAAIEFAFVAPILFALYFLTAEIGQAIDTNKKVSRVASMVGDLVAQQPSVTASELDAIMKIGGALLKPYSRSNADVGVVAIQVSNDTAPVARVAWSRRLVGGTGRKGVAAGTVVTVPDKLLVKGSFYVLATAELGYRPIITWSQQGRESLGLMAMAGFDNMRMEERFYLRPRMSSAITCDTCL